jgi:dipeptidyl aminopeptidase/acylaminoacyl peptidase
MPRLLAALVVIAAALAAAGSVGSATITNVIVFPGTPEGSFVPQLFSVEPSGDNLTQLTTGSNQALNPAISPSRTRIAFSRFGVGIFTMNRDGSGPKRLTKNPRDAFPTWSPNGKTIAFIRPVGKAWRLFLVPAAGGEERRLKQSPAAGRPTWTTTKGLLVPTAADLVQVDPKNGKVVRYFDAELDPVWGLHNVTISPGVSKLTYVGTRDPIPGDQECGDGPCQRYGLFLEDLKAKNKRARLYVQDTRPAAFSPDGRRIAYVATHALVIKSLATGQTTIVPTGTVVPVSQGAPDWR